MGPLLAVLLAASLAHPVAEPVKLGRTAWVFATIDHSEWCPPGNVRIDLQTGRYSLTTRAPRSTCGKARLERPVRIGKLPRDALAPLRAAGLRATREGMKSEQCRAGGKPQELVISNGGVPLLVLTTGRDVNWAPDDLSCWSEAATALHEALDHAFDTRAWRP